MFSHFFIDRPIFATVLSVVIVIVGMVALVGLPIAQYPEVTPPTISVTASYPGASAQVVADTVATPIEQQINGVENMLYMSSRCTNDGQMTLDVTFALGTDLNMAQVLVQNRVAIAEAQLPEEVKRQGVTTKKKSPSILLCVNLISPDGRYDQLYLSNYATIQVKDALARINGVGDVSFLGARDYSMRVWLDPDKLASRGMLASDFVKALREQNTQVAAGRIGQPPVPAGLNFQYTINTLGRLSTEEQFADVIIKTGAKGEIVRVRDVVRDPQFRLTLEAPNLKKANVTPEEVIAAIENGPYRLLTRDGLFLVFKTRDIPAGGPPATKKTLEETIVRPDVQVKNLTEDIEEDRGVQLGAKNYDVSSYLDGKPTITLAVFQLPGSNAVETAHAIRERMTELKEKLPFPPGVDYRIVYDTTVFIEESVHSVYHTLIEAFVLVFIVVLLFLQDWRATILPMIEVPVSLIGTLAVMQVMGFSLNNLSLFGLVLAIGIVVDDAIVVIENVETWMARGLNPRDATRKAMEEVTGPVIAVAVVLSAVFVPTAFMAGITGQFYRQFALTIAVSTIISAFNALTMTPARCALIMKPHSADSHDHREALPQWGTAGLCGLILMVFFTGTLQEWITPAAKGTKATLILWGIRAALFLVGGALAWPLHPAINRCLGAFFRWFNRRFDAVTQRYTGAVKFVLRFSVVCLVVYGGLMLLTALGFARVPVGFIPQQDKGYLIVNAQLPEGASQERTEKVMAELVRRAKINGVQHTISVPGYSILTSTNNSNTGGIFVILEEFEKRRGNPKLSGEAIEAELRKQFRDVLDAQVVVFGAPPIDGLGSTGGFKMQVQDRSGGDLRQLQEAVDGVTQTGNATPGLVGLFSSFQADQPQLFVEVDRSKVKAQGIALSDVFDTLQIYLGSAYVNDVTLFGRNWQLNVQADAQYRMRLDDVGKLQVRNAAGEMVPLRTLVTVKEVSGPAIVNHYNMYPSAEVNGAPAEGTSSGQAIEKMEQVARQALPQSMSFEWTDLTYQQILAGKDVLTKLTFPLAVVFVFLVLAAQYESWSLPLAVILIVPMCLLAAITGVALSGGDNNIFTQIGLVVLIGLAAKNAILIVEFAKVRQEGGEDRFTATVEACRQRLRPILMTSLAFILGVVPLVLAKGAGAEMRKALGVAVFSGMIGVTLFGIFFTPVFYVVIRGFTGETVPPPPAPASERRGEKAT